MARLCHIVYAMVDVGEDDDSAGDGAYDLHDVLGTPSDVGRAIADCLATIDIISPHPCIARGGDLYLKLTIKFCDPIYMEEENK